MNASAMRFPGSGYPQARRRGGVKWWILILFGLYIGYQYFFNREPAAFTGRPQRLEGSFEQDVALGYQAYQQVLAESAVLTTGELPGQVREIAARLVRVGPTVEQYMAHAHAAPVSTPWDKFEWEVSVIESDQANAFCLPGGKIAVYTGIIPVAQSADALAAVMGHEIAHAILRHGAERMAQQKLVQLGSIAAGMAVGEMSPQQQQMVMAAIGAGAKFGLMLPFSRDHETEADYVGLMLAAAACFDPRASIGLWERMGQANAGRAPPEFMSTHPASATRIQQLSGWMDAAMALRTQQNCPRLR
jgi:predicted Zn-dependent protease